MSTIVSDTIVARLEADTADFTRGFQQAGQTSRRLEGSLGFLQRSTADTTKATHLMRGALSNLAIQATGVPGPIGHIAQALLQLGGGATAVITVAAAIGTLALAYRALTADSRDNEKAQEDLIHALEGVGVHAKLTAARMEEAKAHAAIATAEEGGGGFFQRILDVFRTEGEIETRRQKALSASAIAETHVLQAVQEVAKWEKDVADAAERERLARERSVAALEKQLHNTKILKQDWENILAKAERFAMSDAKFRSIEAFRGAREGKGDEAGSKEVIEATFKPSAFLKELERFGVSAGKQFALALITGIQSMQDVMKSVLLQFLSVGLDEIFGNLFHGLFSGGPKIGSKDTGNLIKSASFSLNPSGGMPAPTTPFAVMRDAEWIRFLTGSLVVARSNGFR